MFALAQAAGRAGLAVEGTCQPQEPWIIQSRYIGRAIEMPCLGDVNHSVYGLNLRNSGLSGVWLPCTDDLAAFTARYSPLLKHMGMTFLSPSESQLETAQQYHLLPDIKGLDKLFGGDIQVASLYENIEQLPYPLIVKAERWNYHIVDTATDFLTFLNENNGKKHVDQSLYVQAWVAGDVHRMASAIVLFDQDSRPVRGFTARRQRVAPTSGGAFGESTAVISEWIPELYDGAVELLSAIGWQGFAEVECKQAADGRWKILEVNPRLSGWSCLAEADGAGLLQAYHHICAYGSHLQEACLQRNDTHYARLIASCYHDPDWGVATHEGDTKWRRIKRLWNIIQAHQKRPTEWSLGAWDGDDLRASLALLRRSIHRVWAISRGKTKLF